MTDQQLRLVAGLKDNATPGIRKIGRELKRVRVEPGMAQAQKWVRGFNDDVGRFKKSSLTVASVLSSMGVGGLAAAGSIAGLASQFKALADRVLDVKELGREIGVTTDELRAMERAGQHFGFDPSKMEGALKRLAGLMPIFRRGGNNELTQALARSPELIAKIRGEADDTAAVFKDIMGYVGKLQQPQDRIKFYEQIFGDGDLEKLNAEGVSGFQAQLEAARKSLEPYTQATIQQAQALRDAINDFNNAVEKLELRAAPTVFKGMKQAADDFREAFGQLEKAAEWFNKAKDNPADAAREAAAAAVDAAKDKAGEIYGRWHDPHYDDKREGRGDYAPAKDDADKAARLAAMQAELSAVAARIAADKNPVGFPVREADAIARERELRDAIAHLRGDGPRVMPEHPEAPWKASVQPAKPEDSNLGLPGIDTPPVQPPAAPIIRLAPDDPTAAPAIRSPPVVETPRPVLPGPFHVPSRYDAEAHARAAGGAQDRGLDGFVMGALERPILHLSGTLRTAAAQAERDGIKPAAFQPGGLIGPAAASDPVAMLAAGVKQGMLEAMREWAGGGSGADPSTARGGIIPASFGGGSGGGGSNPALGGGGFGGGQPNLSGGDAQGAEADHIRELAKKYGIDPRVAVAVAKSEGLGVAWGTGVDAGTSFGAFQLHVGGGLGDIYQRETGRDPRNAANAYDMDDWALRYAAKHGWGDWHGAAHIGLRGMAGIGGRPAGGADQSGVDGGGFNGNGDPVGIAQGMLGFGERQSAQALGHIMHAGEWCADFVNGVIEKSGGKGTGSGMADSFARWGKAVSIADAKRGDVIMENSGPGTRIHHAGLVESVDHDKSGRVTGIHMISGNYGHMVRRNLEPFNIIAGLRRGNETGGRALQAAAAQLRDAAERQRTAAGVTRSESLATSHRVLKWFDRGSRAEDPPDTPLQTRDMRDPKFAPPGWHDPNRPDLSEEKLRAQRAEQERQKVEGGIDAHVHIHDGTVRSARVSSRGRVREAGITIRRGPQRTFTV